MISINNHLTTIHKNVPQFLNEVVEKMWVDLNPVDRFGQPMKRALTARVNALIAIIKGAEYIGKVGAEASVRHLKYAEYLEVPQNLKSIITAKPAELKDVIRRSGIYLEDGDVYLKVDEKVEMQPFGQLLLKLFNYESYRASKHCHERYEALRFTEATCPYCNENSVRILKIKKLPKQDVVMLYDIDHFYPKHMFPFLALSFYNHIPSCKTCNQTYKGSKPFDIDTHIHPYHLCFDSVYTFEFNHSILSNNPISKVTLENKTNFPDQLASVLQLESRYEGSTRLARTPRLIDILSKRSHLLRESALNASEHEMLIQALADFGLVQKKEDILSNLHSKFHRDIVKMFDVRNTLNLS
ncbi:hypothetical protein [Pseudomonas grimontii]|uniref:hypothetical protein n=1 Tax=Pseudomonas grimontii TaxID=129847 RepID=UPI0028E5327B|nr:hypothetical protein [Pseudomonas grimontii]